MRVKYKKIIDLQRYPVDTAYFIAKEFLMTERTYKKDLEIINVVSNRKFRIRIE
jgi:hypothetical protein